MKSHRRAVVCVCLMFLGLQVASGLPKTSTLAKTNTSKHQKHKDIPVPPSSFSVKDVKVSTYTPVFRGVATARIAVSGKYPIVGYVLRVDLKVPGIHFLTTPQKGKKETISETTSDFAREEHLQAAINANFFSPCCSKHPQNKTLVGLLISDGSVIAPVSATTKYRYALLITRNNTATIARVANGARLRKVYTAVTGSAEIVRGGKNTGNVNLLNDAAYPNPRTVIGLSRSDRYLYLVAIDGREPGRSLGTTNTESATVLLALGAWTGLNLDGGGSTTMVLQNEHGKVTTINHPSGKTDRLVGASLGLHVLPLTK